METNTATVRRLNSRKYFMTSIVRLPDELGNIMTHRSVD